MAIGAVAASMAGTTSLKRTTRSRELAQEAAVNVMESMRGTNFRDVFRQFNDDPADDLDGNGTAPGANFGVAGLRPRDDDDDGFAGRVVLATIAGKLSEDSVDTVLGMPRDLDGDGNVTDDDKSASYLILPIRVRVEWTDLAGDHALEFVTTLAQL